MPDLVQLKQFAITAVLVGGALAALGLLFPALRRARAEGDMDAGTLLTFSMGWLINLPVAAVLISGGLERRMDIYRELVTVLPGWYEPVAKLSITLTGALAGVLLVRQLVREKKRVPVRAAGLLAVVLWAVAQLASALQGDRMFSLSATALLLCLLAATVLRRGRGACMGVGIFGVTLAAASGLFAAIRFDLAAVPCRHECVLGSAITGVLPNENLLGTALLAALPFVYLGFRGRARAWLVVYVGGMAIATGSRGAVLGAIVLLAVLLAVRPRLDAERRASAGAALAGALAVAAILASVYIVQHDWSTSAYSLTDRPAIWNVATRYIEESPVFGYGPERWETLYEATGEIPRAAQHSTHNQWIDVLFTAGWVGVALLVGMIVAVLRGAGYARPAILTTLATVFLIGVTERAWSIGLVDFASFSLVGLILLGPTGGRVPPSMDLARYLRAVRLHRRLVVATVLGGIAAAAAIAAVRTPVYEATAQMFVSTGGLESGHGEPYEGGLYAQQRMRSYAEVVTSVAGMDAVIERLGLRESAAELRGRVRVAVPPNSVLMDVAARDSSPRRAEAIAAALAAEVPRRVEAMERPAGGGRSVVRVTVTRPPRLPDDPVSPRWPPYLALGALLGLVLGVGGALLRMGMDRRVRDESDTAGAPVLGRVPERRAREAVPVVLAEPFSLAAESLRTLRANLLAVSAEHQLRSIAVSSAVAGEGKTELVANLGLAVAEAGERVAVVDANLRAPRLGRLLGVESSLGLTNVLDLGLPVDVALRRHPAVPLEILTVGPPVPNPGELLASDGFRDLLDDLTQRFDLVLVDAPAVLAAADAVALARRASGVVLVAHAGATRAVELRAAQRALRTVEARVLGVVLNRADERDAAPPPDERPVRRRGRSAMVARL